MFGIPPMSPHLAAEVGVRERETGSRMENRRSERGRRGKLYFTFFLQMEGPSPQKPAESRRASHITIKKRERKRGRGERGRGRWRQAVVRMTKVRHF